MATLLAPLRVIASARNPYYLSASGKFGILYYFDFHQLAEYEFPPGEYSYRFELIDPSAMTVRPLPGAFTGKVRISLAGKLYPALLCANRPFRRTIRLDCCH